jgi:ribosome-binding protein aMBF1 (putative translation factor)
MKTINNREYTTLSDPWSDPVLLTESEKLHIDFEVELIGKLIEARETKGLTQKALAEQAGLKQSAVARLESMRVTP